MKARIFAGASLLLALATPAHAKGFAWCQVNGSNYQAYLSAIVEIDDGPAAYRGLTGQFGKAFQDYVRSSLDPKASSVDCTRQDTRFFAEDYIGVLIGANPGFKFVRTGWRAPIRSAESRRGTNSGKPSALQK
jgi:hypothetical protein